MSSNNDTAFYIVLVIGIIVIAYLIWNKTQEPKFVYENVNRGNGNGDVPMIDGNGVEDHLDNLEQTRDHVKDVVAGLRTDLDQGRSQTASDVKENTRNRINAKINWVNDVVERVDSLIDDWERQHLTSRQIVRVNHAIKMINKEITKLNKTLHQYNLDSINLIRTPNLTSSDSSDHPSVGADDMISTDHLSDSESAHTFEPTGYSHGTGSMAPVHHNEMMPQTMDHRDQSASLHRMAQDIYNRQH